MEHTKNTVISNLIKFDNVGERSIIGKVHTLALLLNTTTEVLFAMER
jgi:hypothetical protein